MEYSCIFIDTYQSQLGPLELLIKSSSQRAIAEDEDGFIITAEHEVVIKKLIPQLNWLPAGMHVESTRAWLFYIYKRRVGDERLAFSIALQPTGNGIQCGGATGQNLIAVELENGIRQMHIGTEDEDAMAGRAAIADYMPARLEIPLLKYELKITTITAHGLSTQIPALEIGERFYFHYIVAENPYLPSADYPEEADISTWFAVEQSRKKLEQSWCAQS